MKKLILGCTLMLCGVIGGTGWLIAAGSLVEKGAWSSILNLFPLIGFGRPEGYVVLLFYVVAVVGAVLAIQAWKSDK